MCVCPRDLSCAGVRTRHVCKKTVQIKHPTVDDKIKQKITKNPTTKKIKTNENKNKLAPAHTHTYTNKHVIMHLSFMAFHYTKKKMIDKRQKYVCVLQKLRFRRSFHQTTLPVRNSTNRRAYDEGWTAEMVVGSYLMPFTACSNAFFVLYCCNMSIMPIK